MNKDSFNCSFSVTTVSRILLHETGVGFMGILALFLIRGCLCWCPVRCWHLNKLSILSCE
ncbi:unnamed protein product, partial [Gulo gulo]